MRAGETFELKVKELVEYELKRGGLAIVPRFAKVFHRKGYWSKDRGKEIIVDVSIEVFRRDASEPCLVWVWECKDYQDQVPVDDVEEFHAKLEQISLHKTKGTIACPNGFQESAIAYAESKGISLVRILPDGSIIRLLEEIREAKREFVIFGLTQSDTSQLESMFYGLTSSGIGVNSIGDLIALEIENES